MIDTDAIKRLELDEDRDAYAAYIRQVTDDGQAIVDCLIRIMEDDSVGAKPHERLEAQQLLDSIAFGHVAVEQAATPAPAADPPPPPEPASPDTPRLADPTRHRHPAFVLSEETLFRLPVLVKQKTDMGKKMADFLNAAVRGELSDFRPHHWIKAVKHLSARGYSKDRGPRPELPGPKVEDIRELIQTLTAEYQEQRAREAASGTPTDPDDDAGATALYSPTYSSDDSVLEPDYSPPCPDGSHLLGCQCAEEDDEFYEPALEHLRQYQDHPP